MKFKTIPNYIVMEYFKFSGFFLGRIEKVLSKATFKISLRWPLNTGLTVEDYKIYDDVEND